MDLYLIIFAIGGVFVLMLLYLYLKTLQDKNNILLKYAVLSSRYEDEIRSSNEKLEILSNAKESLSKEFKLLANQIFEDKTQKFDYDHKEQFEILLKPFREQINNFSIQSQEQFNTQAKDGHLLKNELLRLKEMNEQLSQDALNLTNALKGDNKIQGNWGEIILERILEESGLREGIEYDTQATLKSKDGINYRPDIIIRMPKDRDIIIDSKVSLVSYEKFINEDDAQLKALALKEHLLSVSGHIKGLSSKKYDRLEGINTLDYVILFMPIEGAFLLALEEDKTFLTRAYESNILVVSPSTLLVTLRTIEHIWRTQKQEEHSMKIVDEAEALYEKLFLFVDEMQKLGNALQKARDSYDISMKRLKTGNGNIIKRAENMIELGIKPKKKLSISSEDKL
ncbi:MAG: DNA recombination protein RmuC [Campylobacterota bacterium]|nr:DNA recombination protein RmuC [Campylobacterota bacterium]